MESLFGTEFNDVKAARAAIDAIGKKVGFSLVIQVTKPNCVKLRCSKGKRFKSQANAELATSRHRKTSSQMTGCPYKLLITQRPDGVWQIRDSDNDSANKHNHEMLPQAAFSRYRTSTVEKLKGDIISMYNAGIRPRLVLNKIRSGGHLDVQALTRHDIYNVIQKHREAELGGRSEMQWLFDKLQDDENYYCRHRRDEENRLTALFICPKDSINLLRQYSSVLLMDCTYKTNRFNLPLFNICGITSTKKTFQVAAVFMTGEDQAQFDLFERVIALEDNEARDNRQHLQQQPPPSTAPAVMASANNSVTMPSTTAVGIRFLATFDTYEPGTEMQRSYQRSIQRLEEYDSEETPRETSQLPIRERQQLHFEERESQWSDTDAPGEWDDEINPEFEDAMDNAWAKAEQDAIAIQEDVAANSNTKE
ncbi:hypothetical protein J3F83DRAFT_711706 [Trichoderma novae-zelandiae]